MSKVILIDIISVACFKRNNQLLCISTNSFFKVSYVRDSKK